MRPKTGFLALWLALISGLILVPDYAHPSDLWSRAPPRPPRPPHRLPRLSLLSRGRARQRRRARPR